MKTIEIKVKAFTGEKSKTHKVQVDGETVRVWDSVAGHYTTCHKLSKRDVSRILSAAK